MSVVKACSCHTAGLPGLQAESAQYDITEIRTLITRRSCRTGVVVLAATNRADALDVALMRPGRFDVQLHVPLPDTASRRAILEIHTRIMPLDPSVNLQV